MTALLRWSALASCALFVAILGGCPSCSDICRNDLDCNTDDGKYKCVGNVCQQAFPAVEGQACTGDDACGDGMRCVDDACVFAPACQFIADQTALAVLARDGATTTTTATVSRTDGCAFTIAVAGGATIEVATIDVDTGAVTSPDCTAGRWSSAGPGGWLTCGDVDYVLGRPGAALCFADQTTCGCAGMPGMAAADLAGFCE